jgi:hypothetical protein
MIQDTRVYFTGDIKRFRAVNTTKGGVAWVLTAATLYLVKPDGTVIPKTATSISTYIWGFTTSASDLDTSGTWRRYWKVTDGSTTVTYGDYSFYVRSVR